jgi:hypothetical protein
MKVLNTLAKGLLVFFMIFFMGCSYSNSADGPYNLRPAYGGLGWFEAKNLSLPDNDSVEKIEISKHEGKPIDIKIYLSSMIGNETFYKNDIDDLYPTTNFLDEHDVRKLEFETKEERDAYFIDGTVERLIQIDLGEVMVKEYTSGGIYSSFYPNELSIYQIFSDDITEVIDRASQGGDITVGVILYIEPGDYFVSHSFKISGSNITNIGPSFLGW